MHPYSINSEEHKRISLLVSVISILLAFGLHLFSENIYQIPWWIESPSVIGFYGILYKLFDTKLWKQKYTRKLFGIKTPIIDGDWSGSITSTSHPEHTGDPIPIKRLCIKQTWHSICIYLETETSKSHSFEASINIDEINTATIYYQYINEPKESAPSTMHAHRGSASARLSDDDSLQIEYYSGRDRNNMGSFEAKKVH